MIVLLLLPDFSTMELSSDHTSGRTTLQDLDKNRLIKRVHREGSNSGHQEGNEKSFEKSFYSVF